MIDWFAIIREVAASADQAADQIFRRFSEPESLHVLPYRGFANQQNAYIEGRVLEPKVIAEALKETSSMQNFWNMLKQLESDEVAFCPIQISLNGQTYQVQADEEGYFRLTMPVQKAAVEQWLTTQIIIPDSYLPKRSRNQGKGEVFQLHPEAKLGLISDLDDTVLKSYVDSPLRGATELLFKNAATRESFEGVGELYQKFYNGSKTGLTQPVFYLSSSPWNLYDFLCDFLARNGLPKGPLFLKDYGFDKDKFFSAGHRSHKYAYIQKLCDVYPNMSFILVGDSTQHDASVYTWSVEHLVGRIAAVYIRDVAGKAESEKFKQYKERCSKQNVEMVFFNHSDEVLAHASNKGWIG